MTGVCPKKLEKKPLRRVLAVDFQVNQIHLASIPQAGLFHRLEETVRTCVSGRNLLSLLFEYDRLSA